MNIHFKYSFLYLFFVLILLSSTNIFAQEDEGPIDYSLPEPDWKDGLKKGKIEGWLYATDDNDQGDRLTSSYLEKHPISLLSDKNTSTAWSEGEAGPGIGEVVVVDYDSLAIWIWAGYGKSEALYLANNRPKKIKIYLLGTFCHDCTPRICIKGNFVVVDSLEQQLKDLNGFQKLLIPKPRIRDNSADCNGMGGHDNKAHHYEYKIAIQILSVYKGNKYDDTCITEIMDNFSYTNWMKGLYKN